MIKFSQEKVLLLHKLIVEETGGRPEAIAHNAHGCQLLCQDLLDLAQFRIDLFLGVFGQKVHRQRHTRIQLVGNKRRKTKNGITRNAVFGEHDIPL